MTELLLVPKLHYILRIVALSLCIIGLGILLVPFFIAGTIIEKKRLQPLPLTPGQVKNVPPDWLL